MSPKRKINKPERPESNGVNPGKQGAPNNQSDIPMSSLLAHFRVRETSFLLLFAMLNKERKKRKAIHLVER